MKKKIYNYKHRKALLLCLLAFAGITKTNAQCTVINDQTTPYSVYVSSYYSAGQSFKAPCNQLLNTIIVYCGNNGGDNEPHWSGFVDIYEGVGPTGTPLITQNFDKYMGPQFKDIGIVFPTPFLLNAGTTYTFMITTNESHLMDKDVNNLYPNGILYSFGGGAIDSFPAYDLRFVLDLTSVTCTPTTSTTDSSICRNSLPFTWNGLTFTDAGSQTKTGLTNAGGCDSSATLNLIVKESSTSDTTATACNMFTWHGVAYTTSGDQTFTTTNAAGCDSIRTLHLTINTVPVTTSITNAVCNGANNGSITLYPTNTNLSPFTYRIIGPDSTYVPDGSSHKFTNLKAGTYRVYVKDNTGCIGVAGGLVVSQNAKVTATATGTALSCYGSADGQIKIENPVGTSPFQYKIGSGGSLVSFTAPYTITGQAAGNYGIYVVDANGCSSAGIVVPVTQPAKVSATLTATDVTGCNGDSSGTLTLSAPIGNMPFKYKMTSGGTYVGFTPPFVINGIKANTYSFFIQDASGCVGKTNIVTVGQPAPVSVSYSTVQPTCSTPKGSISLTSTTPGVTFKLSFGSSSFTSQNTYGNLAPGTYRGFAKNSSGCITSTVAIVLSPATGCSPFARMASANTGNEKQSFEVTVSPNPSRNVFKLTPNTTKTEAIQLRVIDFNGKVVYTAKGSPNLTFTFGEALTVGVYMIELKQGNDVKTYKVVKTL